MKRLYQKYLAIPKNGKVSDKVVLGRAAVTALCMLLSLCAFSFSTAAYFTYTVSSEGNALQASTFHVSVTIDDISTSR